MLSIYLTDHFLILLIPINIVLVVAVSVLVGFNVSLNVYALKLTRRFSHTKKLSSLLGSVGLTSGLFIGCPTCVGSLFSLLLGFWSGASNLNTRIFSNCVHCNIYTGIDSLYYSYCQTNKINLLM